MSLSSKALLCISRILKIVAVLIYLAWVIFALVCRYPPQVKPDQLRYQALKDLPAGYRLHPDDFGFVPAIPRGERNQVPAHADPAGKYLLPPVPKGRTFGPADISAAPVINSFPNTVKYLFPLKDQTTLAGMLNSGSHVMVCSGSCVIEDARVLSIVCGKSAPADCVAVLELAKDEAAKLDNKTQLQLVLRRN